MSVRDPDSWMWEQAREFLEKAERLHRSFFQLGRPRNYRPTWEPPADIFELGDELWVFVALPGVDPDRVEVTLDSGVLTIAGERVIPPSCRRATVHRLEIPHGRFERNVELPGGGYELVGRDSAWGCFVITLRKLY
ncbi:MAG: Hsp20/alpha crystallin family protein [Planctomycetota bacterium]